LAGILLTSTDVAMQSNSLIPVGLAVLFLAVPIGLIVFSWRFAPHGSLRRINGTLILKLTKVHPNFAAAEEKGLREAAEQGNWPPGFTGPALVPLRFREPLTRLADRVARNDPHDPMAEEFWCELGHTASSI
jgi:hypothetical protein